MAKSTGASKLKFLLELVNCHDYRSELTEIKKVGSAELRKASCKALLAEGHIECSKKIEKFVIAGPGKDLLKKGTKSLPIDLDPKKLAVLRACVKAATPGQIGEKVSENERQPLLRNMADNGLIKINKEFIDVWLSAQGKQFLRDECLPQNSWTITADKLGYYVKFLRENLEPSPSLKLPTGQPQPQRPLSQAGPQSSAMPIGSQTKPDAQAVLQQINQLDQMMGTDNYLPIYHLREKLQPPLTREELDSRLYELQRSDRIELSSLHDQGNYSDHQVSAGIPQNHGRSLFFISVI